MLKLPEDLANFIYKSYNSGQSLAAVSEAHRNQLILKIADAIKQERNQILEANTYDLEASRDMAIPELLLEWMKLTPDRLNRTIEYLKYLANAPSFLSSNSVIYNQNYQSAPIGLVAFVYESLPHLALIMAGMCLKSGNSLILKGGTEISHSQGAIVDIIQAAIRGNGQNSSSPISECVVTIAPQGTAIKDLVTQEKYLRLIIPYGRPSFVQQVAKQSTISILPAAMGNCYMFLGATADLESAKAIIKASLQGDPDAVNAIEKIVIQSSWLSRADSQVFVNWLEQLKILGLNLRGCERFVNYCRDFSKIFNIALETQWGQAYLDETLAIKIVDNADEAITWMNQYSSGHADVVMSDSVQEIQKFARELKSSNIFMNAHSKFCRLESDRLALGMVSLKTRGSFRGIIDLQSLTTTKKIVTNLNSSSN